MTHTLIRGRLLSFLRRPEAIDDAASYRYEDDGGLLVADGKILAAGPYAQVRADGAVDAAIAAAALDLLEVDPVGFDSLDRKLLTTIIDKFDGGPVGIENLAAAIGEERGTLEDVIEPYLIQQGYLMRTARGRVATRHAYRHFGLRPPEGPAAASLFGDAP